MGGWFYGTAEAVPLRGSGLRMGIGAVRPGGGGEGLGVWAAHSCFRCEGMSGHTTGSTMSE
jgi:hypothetical protein